MFTLDQEADDFAQFKYKNSNLEHPPDPEVSSISVDHFDLHRPAQATMLPQQQQQQQQKLKHQQQAQQQQQKEKRRHR